MDVRSYIAELKLLRAPESLDLERLPEALRPHFRDLAERSQEWAEFIRDLQAIPEPDERPEGEAREVRGLEVRSDGTVRVSASDGAVRIGIEPTAPILPVLPEEIAGDAGPLATYTFCQHYRGVGTVDDPDVETLITVADVWNSRLRVELRLSECYQADPCTCPPEEDECPCDTAQSAPAPLDTRVRDEAILFEPYCRVIQIHDRWHGLHRWPKNAGDYIYLNLDPAEDNKFVSRRYTRDFVPFGKSERWGFTGTPNTSFAITVDEDGTLYVLFANKGRASQVDLYACPAAALPLECVIQGDVEIIRRPGLPGEDLGDGW